ncbi:hypothetical protein IW261DRAFT_1421081 [Armillaria novae-zelandiae]|uniref:Uncharacterized protein n=1 Tax=Armillaria novae-zelandiae TaxID=153914 RepID=A0AA39U8V7_9AGAR|nr:hypothetical protein IW261DRAFT_1421081 [Armillaria novae-zelandiae]
MTRNHMDHPKKAIMDATAASYIEFCGARHTQYWVFFMRLLAPTVSAKEWNMPHTHVASMRDECLGNEEVAEAIEAMEDNPSVVEEATVVHVEEDFETKMLDMNQTRREMNLQYTCDSDWTDPDGQLQEQEQPSLSPRLGTVMANATVRGGVDQAATPCPANDDSRQEGGINEPPQEGVQGAECYPGESRAIPGLQSANRPQSIGQPGQRVGTRAGLAAQSVSKPTQDDASIQMLEKIDQHVSQSHGEHSQARVIAGV